MFDIFWAEWPKKQDKQEAIKAWKQLKPSDELAREIIAAVKKAKKTKKWISGIIPNPSTFIRKRRWEDEYESKDFEHVEAHPIDYTPPHRMKCCEKCKYGIRLVSMFMPKNGKYYNFPFACDCPAGQAQVNLKRFSEIKPEPELVRGNRYLVP